MKRTLLSVLLLLVLMLSLMAVSVSATEDPATETTVETIAETEATAHTHCVCGGNAVNVGDHTACETLTYTPISEALTTAGLTAQTVNFGKLPSGNYFLDTDIHVNEATSISGSKIINICLNGRNITTVSGKRTIYNIKMGCKVSFCDCQGEMADGKWVGGSVSGGTSTYGPITYTHAGSVLNIYGGQWKSGGYDSPVRFGGLIVVAMDAGTDITGDGTYNSKDYSGKNLSYLNLYNGELTGASACRGGNVYLMHAGIMNMYGGVISDGTAVYGVNGSTVYPARGGNLYADSATIFNMHGGTIAGGVAAQYSVENTKDNGQGGNIYSTGKVTISGGDIYNGLAEHNPYASSTTAWATSTPGRGGNIYMTGSNAKLTITGGNVYDGSANGIGGGNIWFQNGTFNMSGGKIWGGIANADMDAAGTTYLRYAYDVCGGSVRIESGTFNMTGGSIGIDAQGNAAGGTNYPSGAEAGNLYVLGTANLSGGTIAHGHSMGKGGNLGGSGTINISGTMVIRDGIADSYGGNWTLYNNGNCTISGGTISGGQAVRGGNIMIDGSSANTDAHALTITGGTISGGIASGYGGNITVQHTCKVLSISGDAEISGGNAGTNGANIYSKGTVTLAGSVKITNGKSKNAGGNIYTTGSVSATDNVVISGGTVTNSSSGNIYISASGSLILDSSVSVSNGSCKNEGGNIANFGTLRISGNVTISNGVAGTTGGNIFSGVSAVTELTDVTLVGGSAEADGGSVYSNGSLTLTNCTISGGTAGESGGNVCAKTGLTINGGTISDGTSTNGGNIYLYAGTGSFNGVTVSGGKANLMNGGTTTDGFGGNIYSHADATTTLTACTINGGLAVRHGGSIYGGGQLTISGGSIADGVADNENAKTANGGNVYCLGEITATGVTVSGGSATHGGNFYLESEVATFTNCNISDGKANLMSDGSNNGNGGNIQSAKDATTTISGCTITGGEAQRAGSVGAWGNVTIENTTITGGYATFNGGNIMTYGNGQLTLKAGTVLSGGSVGSNGAAIGFSSNAGMVQTIEDGVQIRSGTAANLADCIYLDGCSLVIKDAPAIDNIYVTKSANNDIDASAMTNTTPVQIEVSAPGAFAVADSDKSACFENKQGYLVAYRDGKLYLDAPAVVYVSDNGSDDGLGTQTDPFGTLDHAIHIVDDNGTVHIVGTVEVEDHPLKRGKTVTITGDELVLPETRFYLYNNTTFDDLTITLSLCTDSTASEYLSYYFYCNGFTTVFTESVQTRYLNGTQYVDDAVNTYTKVGSDGEETTETAFVWLYGGRSGGSINTKVSSTNLTVLGGRWGYIFGGNNGQKLDGDVHLTVGGKVNEGVDYVSHDHSSEYMILGGSRANDINGTVYMNVTGGTHTSTFGGSVGTYHIDRVVLTVTGGEGMAIYGGGRGGVQNIDTIDFHYEGGTFEQVFGGSLSQCLTGDVNLWVTGGKITRRVYGGCYSNCSEKTGEWTADNFVTGNVRLFIGENANISCDLKDPKTFGITKYLDRGIYGHSRRAAPSASDAENSAIIFLNQAAYEANKGNLTAQDNIMAGIMNGVSAADVIVYMTDVVADDTADTITWGAVAVEDPETKVTGDASAYAQQVKLSLDEDSYAYKGQALTPATVAYSPVWTMDDVVVTYTGNDAPGNATVTMTLGELSVSKTFQIVDGAIAKIGDTTYYSFADAVTNATEGSLVKLVANSDESATVPVTLYLDLNGCSLTGVVTVAEGAVLYGMDSSTNDYDCSDGYGTIAQVVGDVALHHKTAADSSVGKILRYLTYTDPVTSEISFHRIYLGITHMTIRPSVIGVGYKAVFGGDEKVVEMLNESEAFGFSLWLGTNGDKVPRYKAKADFRSGKTVTLRLQNFDLINHGTTSVNAKVYLKLADGTVIESVQYTFNMRNLLKTVDAKLDTYNVVQVNGLKKMVENYLSLMQEWGCTNLYNAVMEDQNESAEPVETQPTDATESETTA